MQQNPLIFSPNVRNALDSRKAILALESTVITHGLPYPQNFEALARLEAVATDAGVVPATIAVIDGAFKVGLSGDDVEYLRDIFTSGKRSSIQKISIRELALASVTGATGGTTVSATMCIANMAGIKVFATGGIGGVHRGWQHSADISSDLSALSRIPVIVVCAGCKAILDVPATIECLESLAVPVLGWNCDDFPTFYSRTSGIRITSVQDAGKIAAMYRLMRESSIPDTGLLLVNPIPREHEIHNDEIEPFIKQAIQQAAARNISSKELTPYLLDNLAQSTKGRSIEANLALLENNVRTAAIIAKELS